MKISHQWEEGVWCTGRAYVVINSEFIDQVIKFIFSNLPSLLQIFLAFSTVRRSLLRN
jgi:phosphotransferase system  glucose/maltose/N-acetylglucosamine-specific IIC component